MTWIGNLFCRLNFDQEGRLYVTGKSFFPALLVKLRLGHQ